MTYCVGLLVREGIALLADTRTNAGVDNISIYRKLRITGNDGERLVMVASAGSLSTTQTALERAMVGITAPDSGAIESLNSVTSIHRAAYILGQALRMTRDEMDDLAEGINFDASLLVGGSVGREHTRLFMIYSAGNFIECQPDTPYLQIGEVKYGKPVLDRGLTYETELYEAVKVGLISFTSTMRSNLSVGLPIDMVVARADQTKAELVHRIDEYDPYFRELSDRWGAALRAAQAAIPRPPYN